MAGVLNHTARQYNLRTLSDGRIVTVRVAPGFNVIDDAHWSAFADKKGRAIDPYVAELQKKGALSFGVAQDDMELEKDPDTKAKSKVEALPKGYAKKSSRKANSEDGGASE